MFKKVILLALGGLVLFFLLSIISPYNTISKSENILKKTGSMYKILSVDSFEIESSGSTEKRDWDVSFSRYRSVAWDPDKKEREEDNSWKTWVTASEGEGASQIKRFDILPQAVFNLDRVKKYNSILLIRAKWDYQGYNWIDIYPSTSRMMEEATEGEIIKSESHSKDAKEKNFILLSGLIEELRLWVWGMGFNYNIEIHLEDYTGNHVIVSGGKINHQGWKEFHFFIPNYMKTD